ncbi:VWA domain-containing protein [Aliikangiella maris]|uniref:VWA domain-containing protein n=2 Tax=Aliikangiella maris TaxID=3162458 RepID=A0ABV3MLE4_9GAMM
MKKLRNLWLTSFLVYGALLAVHVNAKNARVTPDVRVLIDISGSMKKNDPENLRVPALQLITNLLPKKSKAGVWTFGRYVNMMVPLSEVDENWQNKATQTAKKINSAGLYTNIGSVMEKASFGWNSPDPDEKRSLILLTDGMVDISKDPQVNAKERERIIQKVLPKLKKANVAIHTVALSQNADHELLKLLSSQTDGWYQAVDNAEKLQKVFLKIFEQSTQRDNLPLTDNQFTVDNSIEEMTLLVFKKSAAEQVALIDPQGQKISHGSDNGNVRWFSADGYALITVKTPQPGNWKIEANVDPDNRVMVVSKLGLNINPVPNNLLSGESIDYQMELLEDGTKITKEDFLKLINARLLQDKNGQASKMAMFYDSGSHVFKQSFFTDEFEGVLQLTLEVKSPTFERMRNHAVNIYGSPLITEIQQSDSLEQPHLIRFQVREDIVDASTLQVNATIRYPDQEKQYRVIDDFSRPLELKVFPAGGEYSVALDISGKTSLSRNFTVSPAPVVFTAKAIQSEQLVGETPQDDTQEATEVPNLTEQLAAQITDSAQEEAATEPQEHEKIEENSKPETLPTQDNEDVAPPEQEESNIRMWVYIGLGANLFIGLLGFLGWKLIKKKNQSNTYSMTSELGLDDEEDDDDDQDDDREESREDKK